MAVWDWAATKAEFCRDCRLSYSRKRIIPDCAPCRFLCPELLPGNFEAMDLWLMVNTQWRIGFISTAAGTQTVKTGLDFPAVLAIAEINQAEMTPELFDKIKALELYELKRQREGG